VKIHSLTLLGLSNVIRIALTSPIQYYRHHHRHHQFNQRPVDDGEIDDGNNEAELEAEQRRQRRAEIRRRYELQRQQNDPIIVLDDKQTFPAAPSQTLPVMEGKDGQQQENTIPSHTYNNKYTTTMPSNTSTTITSPSPVEIPPTVEEYELALLEEM
jgi:hypothetical protein